MLSKTYERLSSGSRINRAADDPAGLSVSTTLKVKARVLSRAQLNISDGISLLSQADDSLGEVSTLLVRMSELAQQAANGTFGTQQRRALSLEYEQLGEEIRRTAGSVSFNGIKLLANSWTRPTGTRVAGGSGINLAGVSNDGRYISTTENSVKGIRDTESGSFTAVSVQSGYTVSQVLVRGNGDAVVIASNGSGNDIFVWERNTGRSQRVTNSQNTADALNYALSADGSTIAFDSRTRYADKGNTLNALGTGSYGRLTLLNLDTGVVRQSSEDESVLSTPSIILSSDGRYASYYSFASAQYKRFDFESISFNSENLGATTTILGLFRDGRVLHYSTANLSGDNPNGEGHLFLQNTTTGTFRRITSGTGVSAITAANLVLSTDENRIFFKSADDPLGLNTDGRDQLFSVDTRLGGLSQVTQFLDAYDPTYSNTFYISRDGGSMFTRAGGGASTTIQKFDLSGGTSNFDFEAGFGASGNVIAGVQSLLSAIRGVGGYTLTSRYSSLSALDRTNDNIARLADARGSIGASISRLESAARLTASQRDETTSADGRVSDADVAQASAEVVKTQILQSLTASLLAQANQEPGLALTLLR